MYIMPTLDKRQVTITGKVPAEASKIVFTSGQKTFTTFFSADGTGKIYIFKDINVMRPWFRSC